jgi:hypothetical protein
MITCGFQLLTRMAVISLICGPMILNATGSIVNKSELNSPASAFGHQPWTLAAEKPRL